MKNLVEKAFEKGKGILRLAPTWVPRSFCRPGMRIKLHPDDYYKLGLKRGGIDERWLASTTRAENGQEAPEDEGMSYIIIDKFGQEKVLLRDAVEVLKGQLIGEKLYKKYSRWPIYSKFFDNLGPLPHHVHHNDNFAAKVNQLGKPEMYFFPSQLNNHGGEFPYTFFGFNPGTTKEQVKKCLINFTNGDNKLLDLSRAYKLSLDTGWDVPPGILHAPGSLCTYEPQISSDVYAMYQSILLYGHTVPEELLWKDCPQDQVGNFDYLIDVLDWESNVDDQFYKNHFMVPIPETDIKKTIPEGYIEEYICYKSDYVRAKRLTVLPKSSVVSKDTNAYGFIMLQGHGKCEKWDIETPTLIRYGELTNDEFFVSEFAAKQGVTFTNESETEPIVLLKHYSPNDKLIL